jgi:Flp pilus assembly pilin Flp
MIDRVKKMWTDEEGLTTVEYALLLALLVVAALVVWQTFGLTIRAKVASAGNSINGIS